MNDPRPVYTEGLTLLARTPAAVRAHESDQLHSMSLSGSVSVAMPTSPSPLPSLTSGFLQSQNDINLMISCNATVIQQIKYYYFTENSTSIFMSP